MSGIEKLNTTLGSISGQIDNSQSLQASTLIGHGVMIPGTTILTGKGTEEGAKTTTTPFGVELQQPADKVTATITDKDGKVVRTIDIGGLKAGVHTFTWDGTMTDGTDAPSGSYNVSIAASNGGTQLVAQPLQFALVQGVIRSNGGNTLDLGTYGTTTLDEVPGILNCTVKPGRVLEGFSFTGSRGIKARPINATHIKATISVKEEAFVCVFILEGLSIVSMLVSTIAPIVLPHSQTCQSARFR